MVKVTKTFLQCIRLHILLVTSSSYYIYPGIASKNNTCFIIACFVGMLSY